IALNQLVEETLLRQNAINKSMAISPSQIDRNILATESFQINGVFNSDLAVRTMATQGLTAPMYRQSLEQRMLMSQLASAYTGSSFITDVELERFAKLSTQTRDFRYLSVTMGTRTLGTPVSDDEITAYYNNNSEQFAEEESLIIEYVLLDKSAISAELQTDVAELRQQYELERLEFEGSSEKRASHILFEVGSTNSEDVAIELAADTKSRIDAGEEFSDLAMELSIDAVSAEEGGDIGFTDGTAFPVEIEEALNLLELNEVSSPVVSEFGVHLVKLTQAEDNSFPDFEEARDRIERELTNSEVERLYSERLQDLANLAFETGDLLTIEEQLALDIRETEPTPRSGGTGIFSNLELVNAAYSDEVLLDGNNSDVVELSDSQSAVVRALTYREASVLPLEEVEAEIAVILRTEMERNSVQELGSELVSALEENLPIDELLAENDLQWIEELEVERNSFAVNREIVNEVFSLPVPDNELNRSDITLSNDTFVVIELTQVNEGSVDAIPEEQVATLIESVKTDLGNNDFQAYMSSLRESSDIQTSTNELFN
ncbi:MAG: peptidylprolyl isomerase, partial [Pseudohongiellaceae bacterium]